jgi:hypothetical protein
MARAPRDEGAARRRDPKDLRAPLPRDPDLKRRFFLAQTFLDLREGGPVPDRDLAERAAKALPALGGTRSRRKPPDPSTIVRYKSGEIECPRDMMVALAAVLGVDPGWLWFFPHSSAPPPPFAAQADRLGDPAPKKRPSR